MERTTFSVLFFIRRTRLTRNGEAPIQLRVTVNGQRSTTSAKKSIKPEFWDSATGKAIGKDKTSRELNLYLDAVRLHLLRIQRDMEIDGERVTAQSILNKYLGADVPDKKKLLETFREHNDKCERLSGIDMAPATVERYETSFRHTRDFIRHAYRKDDIYLDEVDNRFIRDYEFYLKTERKCSHNTTTKYLKNFKKIIRIALANEWITKDPFVNIKFTLNEVERDFLEVNELQSIIDKNVKIQRLEQVRDIFLFCAMTGLAFSDVKGLKQEHLSTDNDGSMWIRKKRQKTKNMCNIPLLDIPLNILKKYSYDTECRRRGVLLPVPSNQKMNAYLKEIADLCGIEKQLTTHCARRSNYFFPAENKQLTSVKKLTGND